jgi:hypothetical protein
MAREARSARCGRVKRWRAAAGARWVLGLCGGGPWTGSAVAGEKEPRKTATTKA